ncbi:MAG: PhoH family protein [Endomicrobiia bacterium]
MKTFVLDTNVLIHDPQAIFSFADNKVVIPMTVIEELDQFKKVSDERGRNVRTVSRILDSLRKKGKISEGIKLDSGGIIKVELDQDVEIPYNFVTSKADHRILGVAISLQNRGERVIFVSKDINLRIKAEALGLVAQDYEKEKVKLEELYNGWREVSISTKDFESFYKNKYLELKKVVNSKEKVFPNEFFILKDSANPSKSAIAKYSNKDESLIPLFHQNPQPWGLKPLNVQQRFAMELLLCNEITLVTLIGIAGAGKTLLALACGLQKVVEEKQFRHLLVARPVVPMGRDIGFLPGTKEEKLSSWMGAIYDNLDFLIDRARPNEPIEETVNYLFDSGLIEIEALTFLRGRSLPQQYFIIDDAQNLTPHEIKTIISRAGEGTKVVLTGDTYQIDNPYLDATSSGLTYLVECFKGQEIFGHINFTRSERSTLASLAAELL